MSVEPHELMALDQYVFSALIALGSGEGFLRYPCGNACLARTQPSSVAAGLVRIGDGGCRCASGSMESGVPGKGSGRGARLGRDTRSRPCHRCTGERRPVSHRPSPGGCPGSGTGWPRSAGGRGSPFAAWKPCVAPALWSVWLKGYGRCPTICSSVVASTMHSAWAAWPWN
ncbi:hypothetical protein D9M69_493300 [compost metagenome]